MGAGAGLGNTGGASRCGAGGSTWFSTGLANQVFKNPNILYFMLCARALMFLQRVNSNRETKPTKLVCSRRPPRQRGCPAFGFLALSELLFAFERKKYAMNVASRAPVSGEASPFGDIPKQSLFLSLSGHIRLSHRWTDCPQCCGLDAFAKKNDALSLSIDGQASRTQQLESLTDGAMSTSGLPTSFALPILKLEFRAACG